MDKTVALTTDRKRGDGANGAAVADLTRLRAQVSMGSDGERVIQWLAEQTALHSDARPLVIYLHHVTPSRKLGDKLGTLQLKLLDPAQYAADALPEMAHSIWGKAEAYAAGLGGGAQQFALRSYYEDDPSESESSTFFWIRNARQAADREIDSMPASENGVLRLVMGKLDRLEDSFCDLMEGSAVMMRVMREQMNDLHAQALAERQERRAGEEEVRKAKLAELDRQAARESAKVDHEAKRELVSTAKTVGLAIARKWGGIDVRDAVAPGAQQLMNVFQSLSRDEGRFMQVLASLSDSERAGFMEWWQQQIDLTERLAKGGPAVAPKCAPTAAPGQPATAAAPTAPPEVPLAEQLKVAEAQAQAAAAQAAQWAEIKAAIAAELAKGAAPAPANASAAATPPPAAPVPEPAPAAPPAAPDPAPAAPAAPAKRKKKE